MFRSLILHLKENLSNLLLENFTHAYNVLWSNLTPILSLTIPPISSLLHFFSYQLQVFSLSLFKYQHCFCYVGVGTILEHGYPPRACIPEENWLSLLRKPSVATQLLRWDGTSWSSPFPSCWYVGSLDHVQTCTRGPRCCELTHAAVRSCLPNVWLLDMYSPWLLISPPTFL